VNKRGEVASLPHFNQSDASSNTDLQSIYIPSLSANDIKLYGTFDAKDNIIMNAKLDPATTSFGTIPSLRVMNITIVSAREELDTQSEFSTGDMAFVDSSGGLRATSALTVSPGAIMTTSNFETTGNFRARSLSFAALPDQYESVSSRYLTVNDHGDIVTSSELHLKRMDVTAKLEIQSDADVVLRKYASMPSLLAIDSEGVVIPVHGTTEGLLDMDRYTYSVGNTQSLFELLFDSHA
jgi:hypothetical protein